MLTLTIVAGGCGTQSTETFHPAVVTGASMYPAFRGEQFELTCDQCRFPFEFDASRVPRSGMAVCPNCGFAQNDFSHRSAVAPPELKLLPIRNSVSRWETIAFSIDGKLAIKRVIGLPGESIEIRTGNIFCNGKLLAKPVEIQQQMLIPIFDSAYVPSNAANERSPFSAADVDGWRTWQPIRGYRHTSNSAEPAQIEDSYGYNQNLARQLNRVDEVHVEWSDLPRHANHCGIRLNSVRHRIEVVVDPEKRQINVRFSADNVIPIAFDDSQYDCVNSLAVSNCDGLVRVFLNARMLFERPLPDAEQADVSTDFSIQFLGIGGSDQQNRVQIFRDAYYFNHNTPESMSHSNWLVPDGEYFVLGDNAPVSIDSRSYGPIRSSAVAGKVLPSCGQ